MPRSRDAVSLRCSASRRCVCVTLQIVGFHRVALMRVFRPEKIVSVARTFIAAELGASFVEPPPFDMREAFLDSSPGEQGLAPGADAGLTRPQY